MQLIEIRIKGYLLNISFIYVRKTPDNEDINRLKRYIFGSEVVMGDLNLNKNNGGERKFGAP